MWSLNPVPPKILPSQTIIFEVQGLSVDLECTFDGLPSPSITWTTLAARQILNFQIINDSNLTVLTLSSLDARNTGNNTCSASNLVGNSSGSIQLFVQVKLTFDVSSNEFHHWGKIL